VAMTGGACFKQRAKVGNGSAGWRHMSGVEEGTQRGGRLRRGSRPMGAGGGGPGTPLRRVAAQTREIRG
jgi:hypothetical protein